jgi:hypothetical protein
MTLQATRAWQQAHPESTVQNLTNDLWPEFRLLAFKRPSSGFQAETGGWAPRRRFDQRAPSAASSPGLNQRPNSALQLSVIWDPSERLHTQAC